jgi:hypothetical protein
VPVFDQLLGSSYAELPTAVREFHEYKAPHYSGTAYSGGSNSTLARLLRKIFGFPIVSDQLAVDIWPEYKDGRDHWRRRFGERRFASSFFTAPDGVLDERFGPFRFGFRLRAQDNRLYWDFIRWVLGQFGFQEH